MYRCKYLTTFPFTPQANNGRAGARPSRMGSHHLGGTNWESRLPGGVYRTMMFNPLGVNSS